MKRLLTAALGLMLAMGMASSHAAKDSKAARSKERAIASAAKAKAVRKAALKTVVAARPTYGQMAGLHGTPDELALKSSVAYVIDQDTHEVLLSKNDQAVLPIASITKLMTAMVILDRMGLAQTAQSMVVDLPFGQQKLIGLARTLMNDGPLLLLDEPISALDADTRRTARQMLKNLNRQTGVTVLHVTHDQEDAELLGDVCLLLERTSAGRVQVQTSGVGL